MEAGRRDRGSCRQRRQRLGIESSQRSDGYRARGGADSSASSISVRSLGRFNTQTLSSLSTANPVTPPSFHLFGRGLGQSGSYLNFGTVCAPRYTHTASKPSPSLITRT